MPVLVSDSRDRLAIGDIQRGEQSGRPGHGSLRNPARPGSTYRAYRDPNGIHHILPASVTGRNPMFDYITQ